MKCPQCGVNDLINEEDEDICGSCFSENKKAHTQIGMLIAQGHPRHCAQRQVWGDGECECALYKKGYDPYAWIKNITPQ